MENPYIMLLKYRRILLNELSNLTNISKEIIIEKLRELENKNMIEIRGQEIIVKNPLELALHLMKQGFSFKEISRYIDWRDFERITAEILNAHNYLVLSNLSITKPVRFEIDVIGIDTGSGRGIFIDCKHWSRGVSRSSLIDIINKHVERIDKFVKYFSWIRMKWIYFRFLKEILPVIVTLTTPVIRTYNNVIVISIQEFNQFLTDIYTVLEVLDLKPVKINKVGY